MIGKKKVLIVGREASDFLCPLYKTFLSQYKDYEVDLFELRGPSLMKPCAQSSFSNIVDVSLKMSSYSGLDMVGAVMSPAFLSKLFAQKDVKRSVREVLLTNKLSKLFAEYDIVHIYFMTSELFYFLDAIEGAKKVVVSMWGSDLFNNDEDFVFEQQKKLIERADAVTVHHKEMREIFLSKFGRHNVNKLHEMLVAASGSFLDKYVNELPDKARHLQSFKRRYEIPDSKHVVVVGHCGTKIDDHERIVLSLDTMPSEYKDRICLVFPMTYDYDEEYAADVKKACEKIGVQNIFLTSYLSLEELIELRLATEILLRISKIDAFSLALCESVAAGSVIIAGSWLPYGKLRGNNISYEEVYEIQDTGAKLKDVLAVINEYNKKVENNPDNIVRLFATENSVGKLYKIYTNA